MVIYLIQEIREIYKSGRGQRLGRQKADGEVSME